MKIFKNILCIILTFSILLSIPTNALTIPAGYEDAGITTYHVEDDSDTLSYNTFSKRRSTSSPAMQITANNYINLKFAQPSSQENNIPDKIIIQSENSSSASDTTAYSIANSFSYNPQLHSSFNTITAPKTENGANEPKFSYNSFVYENISDYSGELTLNFEDIVLEGRNGLDLRLGRTYQSVAASVGNKTLMILPNQNGYLENRLVTNYSNYLNDRYNLGTGWSFSFPSVQIETEYIPQEVLNTYYYNEEKVLYYHNGNGDVYEVEFTTDTTDSNLKGYYQKDIQFNQNDTAYFNSSVNSYYSLTLSDKTKQYFAQDGRLIGIVDRFGNKINFEHELKTVSNRVAEGNFRYDNDKWTSSVSSNGIYDVIQTEDNTIGSDDGYVMKFRKYNDITSSYILSYPIQVEPLTEYNFDMQFKDLYTGRIKAEIICYDTAYNYRDTKTLWITDYTPSQWNEYKNSFLTTSATRYIQIKIIPDNATGTYIDSVNIDKPQPLISKITDSIGRVITFDYTGALNSNSATGAVTVNIISPDKSSSRTLTYYKNPIEFTIQYSNRNLQEQRLYWYLTSSYTEGEDGSSVAYSYNGGATINEENNLSFPNLYMRYDTKNHSSNDSYTNKPLLDSVTYKDRKKVYEYETVRKHLGEDGYYDTLRITKKYDMYAYVPDGSNYLYFTGELNPVNYTYSGTYDGSTFDNGTGYPLYKFDNDTNLGELWTVSKLEKTNTSVTYSNCLPIKKSTLSDGVNVISDYIYHETFKNSPTEIKNTISENSETKETYLLYSYNEWGGIDSETKEINTETKNNPDLSEKYTTYYNYEPEYHFLTEKRFHNNINNPQVKEIYSYRENGTLKFYKNSVGEKTEYFYENTTYPGLLTKIVRDDPMGFNNVMGEDSVTIYNYDVYGLYPIETANANSVNKYT